MATALAAAVTLLLLLGGVAVAIAFGIGGMLGFHSLGQGPSSVASVAYRSVDVFPLMAVPFFLLAGTLMREADISRRLIDFVAMFVGRLPGGMGLTLVGSSSVFGAISGSSVATVSAIGSVMARPMTELGYPKPYVGALNAMSGTIGILIPPSIPLVVYGITTGTSIGDLFLAGASVGILLAVTLAGVNVLLAGRMPVLVQARKRTASEGFSVRKSGRKTYLALPGLAMPVIILGGIYGGIFTPTEAAAVACAYAVLAGLAFTRKLKGPGLRRAFSEAAIASASLLVILAFGSMFSRYLSLARVPGHVSDWFTDNASSTLTFLLLANILMLLTGMFIEENTAIIILAPLLVPIAVDYGVDPIHFGLIMVLNLGIGLSTPPMAPNLFVAAKVCDTSVHRMVPPVLKFIALAALPVLLVTNAFPALVLFAVPN